VEPAEAPFTKAHIGGPRAIDELKDLKQGVASSRQVAGHGAVNPLLTQVPTGSARLFSPLLRQMAIHLPLNHTGLVLLGHTVTQKDNAFHVFCLAVVEPVERL
tara:strand:- start:32 stop:340 length:309 start_codon:yes stop_codon:yes gene_type:complete